MVEQNYQNSLYYTLKFCALYCIKILLLNTWKQKLKKQNVDDYALYHEDNKCVPIGWWENICQEAVQRGTSSLGKNTPWPYHPWSQLALLLSLDRSRKWCNLTNITDFNTLFELMLEMWIVLIKLFHDIWVEKRLLKYLYTLIHAVSSQYGNNSDLSRKSRASQVLELPNYDRLT